MSVVIDKNLFTLHTRSATYQMKADQRDTLLHLYYGERTDSSDKSYFIQQNDVGFSGSPYEAGQTTRRYSLDTLPQEYSCFGTGDYRMTALRAQNPGGSQAAGLRFRSYELFPGKYSIAGLPALYAQEGQGETLVLHMEDRCSGLEAELYYGVLEDQDVITRAVRFVNRGTSAITLEKAASMQLDWQWGQFDWLSLYGRHSMEQNVQRSPVLHGVQSVGSVRGISSHQYSPFLMLCEPSATESCGSCYGVSFVYSGEFLIELEKDQLEQTRLICGIHPDNFSWQLAPGDSLWLPEAVLAYSTQGIGGVSRIFHQVIRENLCRGVWKEKRRPVLINNWEATYFDFTGDQLVSIAQAGAEMGAELFVLDDGWFGKRDEDKSGLGDWVPNEKKLGCTLKELGERIQALGLKFGLWLEPEGFSEDSDLYRTHPDWPVVVPGRKPCLSRSQLVLDFSRRDVQDYMIGAISKILSDAPISYVKWDFNRAICDKFSHALPAGRQGEFAHRYILGLYRALEELTSRFPEVLFESCCGGGGRFDAGMLYYTPQIWGSDTTDAIERLSIQYGASLGFPISCIGAHVAAVPSHQTGRVTPINTRASVAMFGAFGYELDPRILSGGEKAAIRAQVTFYKENYDLIHRGDYYRLTAPDHPSCTVWEAASPDGETALVTAVYHHVFPNPIPVRVKIHGLKDSLWYEISDGNSSYRTSGAALRQCGLVIPAAKEEYQAWQILLKSGGPWDENEL
nr:alpha-galactosidase [uncultured Oscillibacter sp.]